MSEALVLQTSGALAAPENAGSPVRVLPFFWRDPQSVSRTELAGHIAALEKSCEQNPGSVDLRTFLGMAYAMNYDVYKSMDTLEYAVELDGTHFLAQLKYAELLYRLRALPKAECETLKALELASNGWELAAARKQLREIRELLRAATQKPEWNKPLRAPLLALLGLAGVLSALSVVLR